MNQEALLCVGCEGELTLPTDAMEGEIIVCPDCGSELEVISLNPPMVDFAPMEMEDWGE